MEAFISRSYTYAVQEKEKNTLLKASIVSPSGYDQSTKTGNSFVKIPDGNTQLVPSEAPIHGQDNSPSMYYKVNPVTPASPDVSDFENRKGGIAGSGS